MKTDCYHILRIFQPLCIENIYSNSYASENIFKETEINKHGVYIEMNSFKQQQEKNY
jgi:hypothetical protein